MLIFHPSSIIPTVLNRDTACTQYSHIYTHLPMLLIENMSKNKGRPPKWKVVGHFQSHSQFLFIYKTHPSLMNMISIFSILQGLGFEMVTIWKGKLRDYHMSLTDFLQTCNSREHCQSLTPPIYSSLSSQGVKSAERFKLHDRGKDLEVAMKAEGCHGLHSHRKLTETTRRLNSSPNPGFLAQSKEKQNNEDSKLW